MVLEAPAVARMLCTMSMCHSLEYTLYIYIYIYIHPWQYLRMNRNIHLKRMTNSLAEKAAAFRGCISLILACCTETSSGRPLFVGIRLLFLRKMSTACQHSTGPKSNIKINNMPTNIQQMASCCQHRWLACISFTSLQHNLKPTRGSFIRKIWFLPEGGDKHIRRDCQDSSSFLP